jgi:protein-L-isoaspartate(D-aspartate) O-methyltransferase
MKKEELIAQLKKEKFSDNILKAFEEVDRSKFVSKEHERFAYENEPLPIGFGQTISQPYTIAFMLNLLDLKDRQKILEVGSGSGYVLELIAHISRNSKIFGIERIKELYASSSEILKAHEDIKIIQGDGSKGLKNEKPFDRILISASADEIPDKLINQLKFGGILVAPVKNSIIVVEKYSGQNKIKEYPGFSFVPLIED